MKNTLNRERGHDRAHGAVVHVSFATVSLSIHFHAHLPPPPALLSSPPSLFPSPVSLSCEIYRHWREVPGGIQSADIVVTVRRMRENKDKPKEEAEEREEEEASQFKFARKRYRRPRNAPETKSVSQSVSDRISSNKESNVSPTIYLTTASDPDFPSGYRFYRVLCPLCICFR